MKIRYRILKKAIKPNKIYKLTEKSLIVLKYNLTLKKWQVENEYQISKKDFNFL